MADLQNTTFNTTKSGGDNATGTDNILLPKYVQLTLTIIAIIICLIGLVGNGFVFWFLFFKIKRNQSTVYINNLAVADFTFLVGCALYLLYYLCALSGIQVPPRVKQNISLIANILYDIGFNASCFVLSIISLERCFSVLFPFRYLQYRCPHQSTTICVFLWLLSCLVWVLESFVCTSGYLYQAPGSEKCTAVYLFTSTLYLVVVAIMVSSSLTLLTEIRKTSKQCRPPRLYVVIVITILIFLLNVVPARVIGLLLYFNILSKEIFNLPFFYITEICTSIYCSANPYIFILVGRSRKQGGWLPVKQALEKVFKEETGTT